MNNSISIHDCSHLSQDFKEELINLFYLIDKKATGATYDTSTANMSKELFNLSSELSDKESLEIFVEELSEIIVFAVDDDSNELIGFTLLNPHDELFNQLIPQYKPLLAITYSGVHPEYQNKGVWKDIRKYIERKIMPEYDNINHLVTASSIENSISIKANLSIGMNKMKSTDIVEGDEETILFYKSV